MVAVTEEVEADGLKVEVPILLCVGCGVRVGFRGKSDLMLRWAKMYVLQSEAEQGPELETEAPFDLCMEVDRVWVDWNCESCGVGNKAEVGKGRTTTRRCQSCRWLNSVRGG